MQKQNKSNNKHQCDTGSWGKTQTVKQIVSDYYGLIKTNTQTTQDRIQPIASTTLATHAKTPYWYCTVVVLPITENLAEKAKYS